VNVGLRLLLVLPGAGFSFKTSTCGRRTMEGRVLQHSAASELTGAWEMFTLISGNWNHFSPTGPSAKNLPVQKYQRNTDTTHEYEYVGDCVFRREDGTYWCWTPERRSPDTPEVFKECPKPERPQSHAILWPSYSASAEQNPAIIPQLTVSSVSVRNFEATPNPDAGMVSYLIGVLYLPTCTIHLAPLVNRDVKNDAPSLYNKNPAFTTENSAASLLNPKYQDKQYLASGHFVRPMQDTRTVNVKEKGIRTVDATGEAKRHWDEVAGIKKILNALAPERLQRINQELMKAGESIKQTNMKKLAAAHEQPPLVVTGSAHQQLQTMLTAVELEAMGFAIGRRGARKVGFSPTAGSLNNAHFGKVNLGRNWETKIMQTIAIYLRADVIHSKPIPNLTENIGFAHCDEPYTDSRIKDPLVKKK
jgi:hypothetical protein